MGSSVFILSVVICFLTLCVCVLTYILPITFLSFIVLSFIESVLVPFKIIVITNL